MISLSETKSPARQDKWFKNINICFSVFSFKLHIHTVWLFDARRLFVLAGKRGARAQWGLSGTENIDRQQLHFGRDGERVLQYNT